MIQVKRNMINFQKYVLGFAFDKSDNVILVRKQKPKWQKGLLNGVGGKIEIGETSSDAMFREFREETGLKYFPKD
jgi:8-oxo-dGTP diphosphatase